MTDLEQAALDRIEALERMLAHYRTGIRPTEKLHVEMERTREALTEAKRGVC